MKRLLVVPLLLALAIGVLWLARGPIAASRVEARLEELGYQCEDLSIDVEADLSFAQLAPFSCTSSERAIERIVLEAPIRVELEMLRPRRAVVPAARIEVRRDPVTVDTEGEMGGMSARVSAAIVRMLRLFDMNRPAHFEELEIGELEVVLGGEEGTHVLAEDIHVHPHPSEDGAVGIEVRAMQVPTRAGVNFTFDGLSCRVAQSDATLEGEVGGGAHIGRFELHRAWRFRAQVNGLDEERPRLRFERVE